MSYVLEINDVDGLSHIRLLWDVLVRQTPGASFFQTIDWLETYWKHFGADQKLRVLVVYSSDRPIGILPLCVRTERYKVGNLAVLTYPLHDWGTYYGPIGPNPSATLLAGLRHIHQTPRDWDLLDLRWIDSDAWDRGRTEQAMLAVGFGAHKKAWTTTAVVDLSKGWDAYFATRTSKWRNNYRRKERRLAARGEVTCIHYRPRGDAYDDGDPRWDLYDACEAVSRRSWQGASRDGTTLCHATVRPFLRDMHAVAAGKGAVDLNLLLIDGQPCAFAYNYHFGGNVFGLRKGFNRDLSRDGAGNVIDIRAIRSSFEHGDHFFDMGPGSIESKRHLLTRVETSYRCTHFPATDLRVQALRLKRWIVSQRPKREEVPSS